MAAGEQVLPQQGGRQAGLARAEEPARREGSALRCVRRAVRFSLSGELCRDLVCYFRVRGSNVGKFVGTSDIFNVGPLLDVLTHARSGNTDFYFRHLFF